jgi:hypothetical protein
MFRESLFGRWKKRPTDRPKKKLDYALMKCCFLWLSDNLVWSGVYYASNRFLFAFQRHPIKLLDDVLVGVCSRFELQFKFFLLVFIFALDCTALGSMKMHFLCRRVVFFPLYIYFQIVYHFKEWNILMYLMVYTHIQHEYRHLRQPTIRPKAH